jgi:hypothetical protein
MTASRVSDSMASRVEVVVLFADTIVTTAHVPRDSRFVVGNTRDSHAAVDVPPFPLVEGTQRGYFVRATADAIPTPLTGPATFTFGLVTIRVAPITLDRSTLPRREADRRALAFGAASLTAHIALLAVSTWFATPETTAIGVEQTRKRPTQISRVAVEAQTVKREDKPAPETVPVTTDTTPSLDPMIDEFALSTSDALAAYEQNGLGEATEEPAVETTDSIDNVEGRTFDPDANPTFDTVKVGDYSTVATGTAAGAQFKLAGENGQRRPVIVVSCDASSCLILGGDANSGVREALEAKLDQITGCYEKYEQTAGKKVELDFGIDGTGKIDAVNVGGVGDYDSCVANVIKSIEL